MNETMFVSERTRLLLYILMAVLPVWIDFFTKSTDYSIRGLAMPILVSINQAVIVTLAKTALRSPTKPIEIATPPGQPLETHTTETKV